MLDKIKFKTVYGVEYDLVPETTIGSMQLTIPYEVMAKKIFDPIVDTTVELLKKQIRKIYGPVVATFLVGGFGKNPYLQYKIKEAFKIEENGVVTGYKCGGLHDDDDGNLAAMRGALYYGLDGSRKPAQTDIIEADYTQKESTGSNGDDFIAENYDTLICYGMILLMLTCLNQILAKIYI